MGATVHLHFYNHQQGNSLLLVLLLTFSFVVAKVPLDPPDVNITSVHLVYMTHLDLGFTDTTRNVCDKYFDSFFPAAFQTVADLKANGTKAKFKWTEFPWLIQEFLDSTVRCSQRNRTTAEIKMMETAIENEDIIWHATAVNFLTELLDEDMWDYSLGMAARLNAKYKKTWGTLCGKHSDTPGMSRSAIPALSKHGIKAYHIGYNPACTKQLKYLPPVFRWRDNQTRNELITMLNNNYGSQIEVMEKDTNPYTAWLGTTTVYRPPIQGAEKVALVFQFTIDNRGVPNAEDVIKLWNGLETKFPNAKIQASSLDDFAREVLAKGNLSSLPLITGELGDSWLYATPSDPMKLATFREARRALKEAAAATPPLIDIKSVEYDRYMRRLMKGPEHNWGLQVTYRNPWWEDGYDNPTFHSIRYEVADLVRHAQEWKVQREWMHSCSAAPQFNVTDLTSTCHVWGADCGNISGVWYNTTDSCQYIVWQEYTSRTERWSDFTTNVTMIANCKTTWQKTVGQLRVSSEHPRDFRVHFTPKIYLTGMFDESCKLIRWSNHYNWTKTSNIIPTASTSASTWDTFVQKLEKRLYPLVNPKTVLPDISHMGPPIPPQQLQKMAPTQCSGTKIAFSGATGSVRYLEDTNIKRVWVGNGVEGEGMGLFQYQTFSNDNYSLFHSEYGFSGKGGYEKANITNTTVSSHPVGKTWETELLRAFFSVPSDHNDGPCTFVMQVGMKDAHSHQYYGAPQNISIKYTVPGSEGALMDISLVWTNKTATRLAEAMWFSFVPEISELIAHNITTGPSVSASWKMDIMGHSVSPLEVVKGGTKHKHAVDDGVILTVNMTTTLQSAVTTPTNTNNIASHTFRIQTLDVPLVSPGDIDHLLRYNDDQPDVLHGGMHFNLENNVWPTAFPQWYDDDGLARFRIYSK